MRHYLPSFQNGLYAGVRKLTAKLAYFVPLKRVLMNCQENKQGCVEMGISRIELLTLVISFIEKLGRARVTFAIKSY